MVNRELCEIPITYVVLDILENREDVNWYVLERLAPLHPDFVDFTHPVREITQQLEREGLIRTTGSGPQPRISLTEAGRELKRKLEHNRLFHPAVAMIRFDDSARAVPPGDRLAGMVHFEGGPRLWPLTARFLDPDPASWNRLALVELLGTDTPVERLVAGATFDWFSGDRVVARGEILMAPKSWEGSGLQTALKDVPLARDEPVRKAS